MAKKETDICAWCLEYQCVCSPDEVQVQDANAKFLKYVEKLRVDYLAALEWMKAAKLVLAYYADSKMWQPVIVGTETTLPAEIDKGGQAELCLAAYPPLEEPNAPTPV